MATKVIEVTQSQGFIVGIVNLEVDNLSSKSKEHVTED